MKPLLENLASQLKNQGDALNADGCINQEKELGTEMQLASKFIQYSSRSEMIKFPAPAHLTKFSDDFWTSFRKGGLNVLREIQAQLKKQGDEKDNIFLLYGCLLTMHSSEMLKAAEELTEIIKTHEANNIFEAE